MLAQIVDKESFLLVYDCIVDRSSAQIDSGHRNAEGRALLEKFPLAPWASRRRQDLLKPLDRLNPTVSSE